MELVFLALEMGEESAHTEEFTFAVENEIAVLFCEIDPRHVEGNSGGFGVALQVGEQRAILGLGPGLDGAFAQRLQFVGNDEVEIKVDGVAESLTFGASAVGVVEREEARLGLLVSDVAEFALEALGEAKVFCACIFVAGNFEDNFSGFTVGGLNRIDDTSAGVGRDREAVDQQEHGLCEIDVEQGLRG